MYLNLITDGLLIYFIENYWNINIIEFIILLKLLSKICQWN